MRFWINFFTLICGSFSLQSAAQNFPPHDAFVQVRPHVVSATENFLRPARMHNIGMTVHGWDLMLRTAMLSKIKRPPTGEEWIQQSQFLDAVIFELVQRYAYVGDDEVMERVPIRPSDLKGVKIRGFKAVPQHLLLPLLPENLQGKFLCVDTENICFVPILRYDSTRWSWPQKRYYFKLSKLKKQNKKTGTLCPRFQHKVVRARSVVLATPKLQHDRQTLLNVFVTSREVRVVSSEVILF